MRPLRLAAGAFGALVLVGGLAATAMLSRSPALSLPPAPDAQDVAAVSALLGRLNDDMADDALDIAVSARDIAAAQAVAGRLLPDLRVRLQLAPGRMDLGVDAPVRLFGRRLWLPLALGVPDFTGGPRLDAVRLGAVPLPPEATLALMRAGAARALGADEVDTLVRLADRLSVSPDGLVLSSAPPEDSQEPDGPPEEALSRVLGLVRGAPLPDGAAVAAHQRALEAAIADGSLPVAGSALPALRFTLARAARSAATGDPQQAWTAAILALTRACGSEHIRPVVAELLPGGSALDALPLGDSPCAEAGLHGRVDQRRHFVTAAALRALSRRDAATGIGELKELSDMARPGSGFDVTDLVANQSGIRMADAFLTAPVDSWPALIARIEDEGSVIAALDGIPGEMPRARFETELGGLGSPSYADMMARIEARIDALPLHRP